MYPLSDVGEKDGDFAALRLAETKGINVEPAVQRFHFVDNANSLACQRNVAVSFKPVLFQIGDHFAYPFSLRAVHAGKCLERRIHLQIAVINRLVVRVENHFDNAIAFIHRIE